MAHRKGFSHSATIDTEIQRMVEYIEQDGLEKVEEIQLKTEEEFMIEKNKFRDKAVAQITKYYDRLEDKTNKDTQAEYCRIAHQSRLSFLSAENEVLVSIRKEAKDKLKNVRRNEKDTYRSILTALLLQGIFKLMEEVVLVMFHEDDKDIIDDCISEAETVYMDKTRKNIKINKSDRFLTDQQIGGVILSTKNDRITVNNTLEARFNLVAERTDNAAMPIFRRMLFGPNVNRKHFD